MWVLVKKNSKSKHILSGASRQFVLKLSQSFLKLQPKPPEYYHKNSSAGRTNEMLTVPAALQTQSAEIVKKILL